MQESMPERVAEKVKRMIERLSSIMKVEAVYLYGSYARGNWLKTSDVDLIVVSKGFSKLSFMERLDLVNRLSWELGEKPHLEIIPLTPEELEEKMDVGVLVRDASKYWVKIYP